MISVVKMGNCRRTGSGNTYYICTVDHCICGGLLCADVLVSACSLYLDCSTLDTTARSDYCQPPVDGLWKMGMESRVEWAWNRDWNRHGYGTPRVFCPCPMTSDEATWSVGNHRVIFCHEQGTVEGLGCTGKNFSKSSWNLTLFLKFFPPKQTKKYRNIIFLFYIITFVPIILIFFQCFKIVFKII